MSELGENLVVPKHIAIILDGNGRWAKKHKMPRNYGHTQGSKIVEQICEDAYKLGVEYLTVYAFSSENWIRPKEEVDALMKLLRRYMSTCIETSQKNNMCVRIIGDINKLESDLQVSIKALEEASKNNTGLKFQVAINYGGRDDIVRAAKSIAKDVKNGIISEDNIDEAFFSSYLDTHEIPDPDLLIRTGGEQRLSNFLLWQNSYTDFYFTNKLWPDFTRDDLIDAIGYYNTVERKHGGLL